MLFAPRCRQIGFNDRQQLTRLTDLVEITSRSAITLLTLIELNYPITEGIMRCVLPVHLRVYK